MFILVFEQLVKMFFIMLLAFFCYRIKLINQEGNQAFSTLLLMVVNPFVIITVYQTDYDPVLVRGLLYSFLAAAITHIAGILISILMIRKKEDGNYCIERYNAVYSNCGFIGIPLVSSVLGSTGVFYLSAYMIMFNIFSWTHGVVLMSKKCSPKTIREGLLSPIFVASIIALILYFAQIRLPEVVYDSMKYVADMNTPLAMMIAGFSVAQSDIGKMIRNLRIYYVSAIRLLVVPLVMLAFLWIMHLPQEVAQTILIEAACPAAATGTMMAIRYKQNYTYSSEIFALSTILSLITIPGVVFLAELIL